MMDSRTRRATLATVVSLVALTSCGKKNEDTTTADVTTSKLAASGALMLEYAASSLSSTQKAPTSALMVAGKIKAKRAFRLDAEVQSTVTPACTNKGAPWSKTASSSLNFTKSHAEREQASS